MRATQILLLLIVVISGCSNYSAPIISREQPPSTRITKHQVAPGDTLYSIAWRYDLDVRRLARANGISQPYTILKGQVLSLNTKGVTLNSRPVSPPTQSRASSSRPATEVKSAPKLMVFSKKPGLAVAG
ncbi:LysM peptidoglycan-binding domain-containing protein [Porticoccaceae bacterium]|nr:LysM peptidoglycan-binding domain-containing protein [Porticoccaceae bacterium]